MNVGDVSIDLVYLSFLCNLLFRILLVGIYLVINEISTIFCFLPVI